MTTLQFVDKIDGASLRLDLNDSTNWGFDARNADFSPPVDKSIPATSSNIRCSPRQAQVLAGSANEAKVQRELDV